jgi:hypothetical protein
MAPGGEECLLVAQSGHSAAVNDVPTRPRPRGTCDGRSTISHPPRAGFDAR